MSDLLKGALTRLEADASIAEGVKESVHYYGDDKNQLAKDIRIVLAHVTTVENELADNDRILRASVRDEFKTTISAVGAVQNEIAALESVVTGLQLQLAEEQAAKFVPGCWRCAKCNFELNKSVLYAKSGNIGPDLGRAEPCPNDGEPMHRVTWKEDAMRVAQVCTGQVERAVKAESQRDALVMAMNNILLSSKWSHTPATAYATIAREVLSAVEFPEDCETDVGVRVEEEQRQIIVLALAKLTFSRPGWSHALLDTAKKLQGEAMFHEFIKDGPDPEK